MRPSSDRRPAPARPEDHPRAGAPTAVGHGGHLIRESELLRLATRVCLDDGFHGSADEAGFHDLLYLVDWAHVLWLGRQHRVLLLLERALDRSGGPCPQEVLDQLVSFRMSSRRRRLVRARELCLLQRRLDHAGLDVTTLGPLLLSERYYADPLLGEAELIPRYLVARADRDPMSRVLAEGGYTDHPLELGGHERGRFAFVGGLPTRARAKRGGEAEIAREIFERGEVHRMSGTEFRIPSRDDWLRLLSARLHATGWLPLRVAFDVVTLARTPPALEPSEGIEGDGNALVAGCLSQSHRWLGIGTETRSPQEGPPSPSPGGFMVPPRRRMVRMARRVRGRIDGGGTETGSVGRFSPTPPIVRERMLEIAGTGPDDVVFDLGCGDGDVVRTAASRFGARGVGVDLDPEHIARATEASASVADRVRFLTADLFDADVSEATVVCLYLELFAHSEIERRVLPKLRPGTRIVSHNGHFTGWPPDHTEIVPDGRGGTAFIYMWTVE